MAQTFCLLVFCVVFGTVISPSGGGEVHADEEDAEAAAVLEDESELLCLSVNSLPGEEPAPPSASGGHQVHLSPFRDKHECRSLTFHP